MLVSGQDLDPQPMRERVSCDRCKAHRDCAVWPGPCRVCGYYEATSVEANAADVEAARAFRCTFCEFYGPAATCTNCGRPAKAVA